MFGFASLADIKPGDIGSITIEELFERHGIPATEENMAYAKSRMNGNATATTDTRGGEEQ